MSLFVTITAVLVKGRTILPIPVLRTMSSSVAMSTSNCWLQDWFDWLVTLQTSYSDLLLLVVILIYIYYILQIDHY